MEPWQLTLGREIEQHRREGWGWRYDGLESWPTDKIFAQLRELGIDTDSERFHQQAVKARRIKVLDDDWDSQLSDDKKKSGFWQDFPLLAVPVLWERLASDVIHAELVERRLYAALSADEDQTPLADVDGLPADLAAAMGLARYLQGFPADQRSAKFEEVNEGAYYNYAGWLLELIENRGADHPDLATQLADVMSDCTLADRFQTELAMALAVAGRREEAILRARAALQRFPDDLWVKILSADVFEQLEDDAEAIRLWLEALPLARDRYEWEAVTARLEDGFERTGKTSEFAALLKAHPSPEPPTSPPPTASHRTQPVWIDPDFAMPMPLTAEPKIGRNDPCPCGSGKKYKKCCLP